MWLGKAIIADYGFQILDLMIGNMLIETSSKNPKPAL
jgi:hypothetical protein